MDFEQSPLKSPAVSHPDFFRENDQLKALLSELGLFDQTSLSYCAELELAKIPVTDKEREDRKRALATIVFSNLYQKGVVASDAQRMDFFCQNYNLNPDDPPKKFLRNQVAKDEVAIVGNKVIVFLNPYLHLDDADIVVWTMVEAAKHWQQKSQALKVGDKAETIESEERTIGFEIEAKEMVLRFVDYLDLRKATTNKLKEQLRVYKRRLAYLHR